MADIVEDAPVDETDSEFLARMSRTLAEYWTTENALRLYQIAATLRAENERLRGALEQISGKNDLSAAPDNEVEAYARAAIYECEMIARAALSQQETSNG